MPIPNRDILDILNEVNKSLADTQSLSTMTKRSGWSKFHFLREFHRVTSETPKQYVQRVRLEKAAAALGASSKPVLQVALDAGFHSHEVFVRAFRRRFNCSPSQYRKGALAGRTVGAQECYETLVHAVSPCIKLFHLQSQFTNRSGPVKEPKITQVTLEQQPILFIRRNVSEAELQPLFAECFGKLFGYGVQHCLPIAGQPIARYVSIGPGLWTVDCVLPLTEAIKEAEDLQAGVLDGGKVLKAEHFGPYEELKNSYIAIQTWMEREKISPRGAHWEQYVTDPGEEPDAGKWQTDIYWPVQ